FTSEVARLTAAGNSNTTKNYSTTDVQPLSNWNYYRIKQVDKDGRTTYSNIAAINFEKAAALLIVYPNPAKEKLTIEYTSTKTGNVQMQVMDSKGSLVLANTVNVITGRNTNTFNIAALSKGVYVLKCSDADGNVNFVKFIKE
ncbi:MAG: T9SS type A sorting domain-containing protein, partial [Chitinophagaceae bacterium]|nr:T9SS type A sorting domain-containing protein [Chitinophagaceae bacterium]